MNKKLLVQILLILPCISLFLFAHDSSENTTKIIHNKSYAKHHNQEAHPTQNDKIIRPHYPMNLSVVTDAQGNVIGAYKMKDKTKDGYRYGSFYKNLNQAPISVIESGRGTPAHISVPGATSNIVGYLYNHHYSKKIGSSKMIMLCQYNIPIEIIKPIHKDMPAQEEPTLLPAIDDNTIMI